jgi:Bacterial Ig domain
MKKTHLRVALCLSFFTLILACKKMADVTPAVATAPTLTLNSPNDNDQLLGGTSLNIKGQVADATGLKTLSIKITDDKTSAILFQADPSVSNQKNVALNTSWTVKVNDWTDATMTITAVNIAGMQTEKLVKFKLWL